MHAYLITAAVFLVAWSAAWFVVIHPALQHYARTTRLMARVDAAEGSAWRKVALWLEGKKAVLLLFLTSGFEAGKAAVDQATSAAAQAVSTIGSLTPDAIAPLQDKSLWAAFFGNVMTLHIVAALQILAAILTVKGHLTAARIVPAGAASPAA